MPPLTTFVAPYLFGQRTGSSLPSPTVPGLSQQEQQLIQMLHGRMVFDRTGFQVLENYYHGQSTLYNLQIAVPQSLSGISTIVDWPRICCDPLIDRCIINGFRLPDATDIDDDLEQIWQNNDMDAEVPLAFLDSLVDGAGYLLVGSNDDGSPLITVESPLNMAMSWDVIRRKPGAALQYYQLDGQDCAALYLPGSTIYMDRDERMIEPWYVRARDNHGMDIPVFRLANRARSKKREGNSEITKAIRDTTDSAMRSLLGMEIAREFYSVPHRYVLGADESDFVDKDGNPKTGLELAMNKFLAFSRNEDGDLPTVGEFKAYDPTVYTKAVDEHAQLMASYTQFPPAWFGLHTRGNPTSAEAMKVNDDGAERRSAACRRQWRAPVVGAMSYAWSIANGGQEPPPEYARMQIDWKDTSLQSDAQVSDAVSKQVATGIVPAHSDVILKKLGYSPTDRAQLEQELAHQEAEQALQAIALAHAQPAPGEPAQPGQQPTQPPKPGQVNPSGNANQRPSGTGY